MSRARLARLALWIVAGLAVSPATRAEPPAPLRPLLVNGALTQEPRSSVALCEGDTFYGCRVTCGGTLVAPNLVVTSRHCADVAQLDTLDCSTYRFSGTLKPATSVWITVASPVSNDATFHQGLRWDIPRALGCGHDLAFLTLKNLVPAAEATPQLPATADDAVRALGAAALDVYGYGRVGPDAPIDPRRRHVTASVLCIGGRDPCKTIAGGRELEDEEFAIDADVCPGDSGSGVFAPGGALLGTLARSIGGSNVCAFGVYTRLAPHGLLLARAATAAASLGAYAPPAWSAALERAGNSPTVAPRSFGAPCDDAADCNSAECRSYDDGLAWTCARKCADGCSTACRHTAGGDFCFAEAPAPEASSCGVTAKAATPVEGHLTLALVFAAWALVRRTRRR
jgi:hypothetical protein